MVPLLNRHSFLEAMHLPMETYSQLLREAPHVKPIWCPLIVSEAGYIDGWDFASHGIAVPVLFCTLGSMVDVPGMLNSVVDTLSNLSASDVLDGVQGVLDVVGLVPGLGEIADGINGVISLARGDYVGAALSFTSMIPIVGDAIGKGGKAARFIASKADDVLAAGRQIVCRVTRGLCFEAGTDVLLSSMIMDDSFSVGSTSSHLALQTAVVIQAVPLGARVPRVNPRPWEFDASRNEPNSGDSVKLTLMHRRPDGTMLNVEMLRPKAELERIGAKIGSQVALNFNDLLAGGMATIEAIEPCPPIAPGEGNVVTARIVTRMATELLEVELVGGVRFSGTPIHPVWSVDADDWVPMEALQPGDRLLGDDGPVEIISVRKYRTAESVYNLEIHGDHVYQITELGILVHNACDSKILGDALKAAGEFKPPFLNKAGKSIYQAAHIVPSKLLSSMTSAQKVKIKQIQALLKKHGLNNAAENGFWARGANGKYGVSNGQGHNGTHTTAYFDDLIAHFGGVDSPQGAINALAKLKNNIMNGSYL